MPDDEYEVPHDGERGTRDGESVIYHPAFGWVPVEIDEYADVVGPTDDEINEALRDASVAS